MPPSKPVQIRARRLPSMASASARAASAKRCTNVRDPSPAAAVARSRQLSTSALLVMAPESKAARKVSIIAIIHGVAVERDARLAISVVIMKLEQQTAAD